MKNIKIKKSFIINFGTSLLKKNVYIINRNHDDLKIHIYGRNILVYINKTTN